jgi:hypothetical protein
MEEIEITESFTNKIDNINDSIECIRDELYKIQLFSGLLGGFVSKYDNEISCEFKEIVGKINKSIQKINDKSYILEINKLKKLIKTRSGKIIELSTPLYPFNNYSNNFFDESLDQSDSDSDEISDEELKISSEEIRKKNPSPQLDLSLDLIDKIEFNVNNYTSKKILCNIAFNIFKNMFDLSELKISQDNLKEFIHQVSLYYHNNPYHNFRHAVTVLQFTYLLIKKTEAITFMNKYELFGLMIASFVHDIDHPGHTNFFEVNLKSHLALKYNDKSVLENHHCSLAFFILHSKNVQLLRNLDEKDFSIVREMVIECVLSTDMKFHGDLVKNLENKFISGWNWESKQDRLLFAKIIIHTADISNQVRPFEVSLEGSLALRREFAVQIEKEKKLNLPSLEYMKLNDDKSFYSSEHFFSQNTVKPIWNVLIEMFPGIIEYKEHLEKNILKWKELLNGVGITNIIVDEK